MKSIFLNGKRHEYDEQCDEDDYFYDIELIVDCKVASVLVSKGGVTVAYDSGAIKTNITPDHLFPNRSHLSPFILAQILQLLENIGYEGKFVTWDEVQNES